MKNILFIFLNLFVFESKSNNNISNYKENIDVSYRYFDKVEDQGIINLDKLIGNYSNNTTRIMGGYRISRDSWLSISKKNSFYYFTLISTTIDEYNYNESRKELTSGSLKLYNNKVLFIGGDYGNRGAYILINNQTVLNNGINSLLIQFSNGRGNPIIFEKSTLPIKSAPVFKFKIESKADDIDYKSQTNFNFQFFNDYYKKSRRFKDQINNNNNNNNEDYIFGVIKEIHPNSYYMGIKGMESYQDDIQAYLNIVISNGPGKGQTINVSSCLRKYSTNCSKCISLIDKLKVGTPLKFKVIQIGNGEGSSFWFTDIAFLN